MLEISYNLIQFYVIIFINIHIYCNYWGDTPIRTPGRVSVARSEIVIRFLGCPNPENHRVSDLPAPLVGKSRFFTGVQIPEFRIPGV